MKTSYNPFSLEGKTILVTGASSGIGRATAIECSKMGATVIISARNQERLNETLNALDGEGHIIISADLTKEEEIKRLVKECPNLNGVAICSGVLDTTPALFATKAKFNRVYEADFFGPAELGRLLVKSKKITREGSIVWVSSIAATIPSPANGIYGSAKLALIGWMKYFALEMKPKGIRVNTVSPGMIDTASIHNGSISEEQLAEDKRRYIHGRYGRPDEIGKGIVYLLSDASIWVSGTNLVIDGCQFG